MTTPQSDILAKLRSGVEYTYPVKVRALQLQMRPLTITEYSQVADDVADHIKGLKDNSRTRYNENVVFAMHVLRAASKESPETKDEDAVLGFPVLQKMTNDEISTIYDEYIAITDKVNPQLETMPVEELKALVELIKKKELAPSVLSFRQAVALVYHLLAQSEDSQADKLSGGSLTV